MRFAHYNDCLPLDGDGVAQQVTWQNASLGSLTGQVIRLDFLLQNADLYTFRASGPGGHGQPVPELSRER